AAGAWSREIARMLGRRMLLETERGYHVMLPQPDPTLRRPVFLGDQSVFLVPMTHGLRVTSGVEFGGLQLPPDYRRIRNMVPFAKRVMPQVEEREMSIWMGFRPSTPDTRPILGEMPGAEGVFFATGGSHIGMTLGPIMGKVTADLVAGRDPGIDMNPYAPDRW
ncbi:MAG: FAD-binding oxidoreductase, partial [Pseudomonadota bacterium]|nr:FAD-binding oxidoreductase [Pseudomonadota bacterium]